jgi:hypothetical protein
MRQRLYGVWSGSAGSREDTGRCIVQVVPSGLWGTAEKHQCNRNRGHGPAGLYCRAHGAKIVILTDGRHSYEANQTGSRIPEPVPVDYWHNGRKETAVTGLPVPEPAQ